jgi:hypothetical protein
VYQGTHRIGTQGTQQGPTRPKIKRKDSTRFYLKAAPAKGLVSDGHAKPRRRRLVATTGKVARESGGAGVRAGEREVKRVEEIGRVGE